MSARAALLRRHNTQVQVRFEGGKTVCKAAIITTIATYSHTCRQKQHVRFGFSSDSFCIHTSKPSVILVQHIAY